MPSFFVSLTEWCVRDGFYWIFIKGAEGGRTCQRTLYKGPEASTSRKILISQRLPLRLRHRPVGLCLTSQSQIQAIIFYIYIYNNIILLLFVELNEKKTYLKKKKICDCIAYWCGLHVGLRNL